MISKLVIRKISFLLILSVALFGQSDPIAWQKHLISDTLTGAKMLVVVNLDRDSLRNMDVVVTANPEGDGVAEDSSLANVLWFKNLGNEQFEEHVVDYLLGGARGLAVGDLDSDGWAEIVAGARSDSTPLYWYKHNGNPLQSPWQRVAVGGPAPNHYAITIVDLDQDGRADIVDAFGDDANYGSANSGTVTDSVRFLRNLGLVDTLRFENRLIDLEPSPAALSVADFDKDGDLDVAGLSWTNYASLIPESSERLEWWAQQTDTSFVEAQDIKAFYAGNDVAAVDLDQDGDFDLVVAGYKNGTLDWWQNDGSGSFTVHSVLDSNLNHPRHLSVKDIDGDGDYDIALTVDDQNSLFWYENDGALNFTRHLVDGAFSYAYFVQAADLDGDGDCDLVATAQNAGQLAYWESDLAQEQVALAGSTDTLAFYAGRVRITYDTSSTGGLTSVFFNHGNNSDTLLLGAGVQKVAPGGYYTIVSHAASYKATLIFRYDSIAEWQALLTDENLLRICYWNENTDGWEVVGSPDQLVDTLKNQITVFGVNQQLHKFSRFTLCTISGPSALPADKGLVAKGWKHTGYPNPFNAHTVIGLEIPASVAGLQPVSVEIYNVLGQRVQTLFHGRLSAGRYRFVWKGRDAIGRNLSSGWYVYRVRVGSKQMTGRLLLVR